MLYKKTGLLVILCTWAAFQGPKKSWYSGPTPSKGPCNGFTPIRGEGEGVRVRSVFTSTFLQSIIFYTDTTLTHAIGSLTNPSILPGSRAVNLRYFWQCHADSLQCKFCSLLPNCSCSTKTSSSLCTAHIIKLCCIRTITAMRWIGHNSVGDGSTNYMCITKLYMFCM